jgi:glutamate dehydrogenase
LPQPAQADWQHASETLVKAGVRGNAGAKPDGTGVHLPALDLVDLAHRNANTGLEQAARAYFGIEAELSLTQWRAQINRLPTDTLWQTQARGSARDDVYSIARQITLGQLTRGDQERGLAKFSMVRRLGACNACSRPSAHRLRTLAPVSVALRELRHLA